jgi:hypothetical protein
MKIKIFLTVAIFYYFTTSFGQQNYSWDKWQNYIGDWIGEGSGIPGQGGGTFSFTLDLDKNVLIRKSHSEYPSTEGIVQKHDDLMVIYLDINKNPSKAIYFDNEGHTINYQISYVDQKIILTSEKVPNNPVFRLVYSMLDNESCNTRFEISQDGEQFTPYIQGNSKRVK